MFRSIPRAVVLRACASVLAVSIVAGCQTEPDPSRPGGAGGSSGAGGSHEPGSGGAGGMPGPPERCGRSGTVRVSTSAAMTLQFALTDDFIYARQGNTRPDGSIFMSVSRFSVDTLAAEQFVEENGILYRIIEDRQGLYLLVRGNGEPAGSPL